MLKSLRTFKEYPNHLSQAKGCEEKQVYGLNIIFYWPTLPSGIC